MEYTLQPDEHVSEGIKRILAGTLDENTLADIRARLVDRIGAYCSRG